MRPLKEDLKKENPKERLMRLIGHSQCQQLENSHVIIAGLGGVGSWAAEAIARSFVGEITLIDCDEVVASNINRQLVADSTTIGESKVSVMSERIKKINPRAKINSLHVKLTEQNIPDIFPSGLRIDYVIDAIDDLHAKCALINHCYHNKIKLIVSAGAAGRFNPADIRVTDLATTRVDRLGRAVRRRLKDKYGLANGPFGIKAICSKEIHRNSILWDESEKQSLAIPLGTSVFVTASFGMFAASVVIRELLGMEISQGMDA